MTPEESIGITHAPFIMPMEITQCHRTDQKQTDQRKDCEEHQLGIETESHGSGTTGKGCTDGETHDKKVASGQFKNQADDGNHRPRLPKML